MTIDTWVSLAALVGVLVTLGGLILAQGQSLRADLSGDIAQLDLKVDRFRTELKGDFAELRTELKGDIAGLRTELKGDITELRTELKGDIAGLRTELKGDIRLLDDRVYALAAGLRPRLEEAQA